MANYRYSLLKVIVHPEHSEVKRIVKDLEQFVELNSTETTACTLSTLASLKDVDYYALEACPIRLSSKDNILEAVSTITSLGDVQLHINKDISKALLYNSTGFRECLVFLWQEDSRQDANRILSSILGVCKACRTHLSVDFIDMTKAINPYIIAENYG